MNFGTFWDTQNFNLGHRSFATENSTSYILVEALSTGLSSGQRLEVTHQQRGEPLKNAETH